MKNIVPMHRTSITITSDQKKFADEEAICLSRLLQNVLNNLMKEEKQLGSDQPSIKDVLDNPSDSKLFQSNTGSIQKPEEKRNCQQKIFLPEPND